MNRNFALAIVLAAAGNAFAEGPIGDSTPFQSTATRAQVQAELAAFRAAGASPWADEYNQLSAFRSSTTRAQVMSELMSARQEMAAYNGEDSGSSYMARNGGGDSGVTRMASRTQAAR